MNTGFPRSSAMWDTAVRSLWDSGKPMVEGTCQVIEEEAGWLRT